MTLDYKLYLHDSDKAAMAALKAIPGFSQVMKAFMKIWSEQQFRLINMSTNLHSVSYTHLTLPTNSRV